jgi:hypothetical protein
MCVHAACSAATGCVRARDGYTGVVATLPCSRADMPHWLLLFGLQALGPLLLCQKPTFG